jgi:hypothetical protein
MNKPKITYNLNNHYTRLEQKLGVKIGVRYKDGCPSYYIIEEVNLCADIGGHSEPSKK